jgi:hypothetical protein
MFQGKPEMALTPGGFNAPAAAAADMSAESGESLENGFADASHFLAVLHQRYQERCEAWARRAGMFAGQNQ